MLDCYLFYILYIKKRLSRLSFKDSHPVLKYKDISLFVRITQSLATLSALVNAFYLKVGTFRKEIICVFWKNPITIAGIARLTEHRFIKHIELFNRTSCVLWWNHLAVELLNTAVKNSLVTLGYITNTKLT